MTELRIITSNIRFSNPSDGSHDWPNRLPLLADLYQSFKPDILATQEGRQIQIKELDDSIPDLDLVDSHRSWIDERMYPCLFVNLQTISVERSGDIWLSKTPHVPGSKDFDSAFPRLCTWAEVTVKVSGEKLMIVNTHLDHILSSTRLGQIHVLINEVKKINDRPLMIMGDFNESPLTEVKKDLMDAFGLKDPWIEKNYAEETSHHGFSGTKAVTGDRIDWILMPKNFECTSLVMDKRSIENVYPSDHYPLLATVIPK
ncbi:endonuclease/exonuclease/phosphatase family protein [Bacteriovorax sp. PP10]|uniref:Endonuclease/exonuclease/phosphatase family protein n=1 Tax=Bacteriovorax antarcticus TaxID=3088717 RepID=A0ABU5VUI2_9BACT|nr:endonuclease/exonuclease/phosphatase family protein [Bacteriovorax sp. PP10]MEA9356592.1 endonuclease/exonuclease/phosphatase family protein [Bacteriovorax sp. PP10]